MPFQNALELGILVFEIRSHKFTSLLWEDWSKLLSKREGIVWNYTTVFIL